MARRAAGRSVRRRPTHRLAVVGPPRGGLRREHHHRQQHLLRRSASEAGHAAPEAHVPARLVRPGLAAGEEELGQAALAQVPRARMRVLSKGRRREGVRILAHAQPRHARLVLQRAEQALQLLRPHVQLGVGRGAEVNQHLAACRQHEPAITCAQGHPNDQRDRAALADAPARVGGAIPDQLLRGEHGEARVPLLEPVGLLEHGPCQQRPGGDRRARCRGGELLGVAALCHVEVCGDQGGAERELVGLAVVEKAVREDLGAARHT